MTGKQILIVEDEKPIRDMIAFGLRRAGYHGPRGRGLQRSACAHCRFATRPGARRLDVAGPERARTHALDQAQQGYAGPARHHADGARRGARQGRRPRRRRRRLRHQAVQPARTAGAHPGCAAARSSARGRRGDRSRRAQARHGESSGHGRASRPCRSARPSTACCSSSWSTRSACTRAASCSIASGAATSTSRSARSTCTSAACARHSSRSTCDNLVQTVRGAGYRFSTRPE